MNLQNYAVSIGLVRRDILFCIDQKINTVMKVKHTENHCIAKIVKYVNFDKKKKRRNVYYYRSFLLTLLLVFIFDGRFTKGKWNGSESEI